MMSKEKLHFSLNEKFFHPRVKIYLFWINIFFGIDKLFIRFMFKIYARKIDIDAYLLIFTWTLETKS